MVLYCLRILFAIFLFCVIALVSLLIVDKKTTEDFSASARSLDPSPVFFVWQEDSGTASSYRVSKRGFVAIDIHSTDLNANKLSWDSYVDISGVFQLEFDLRGTLLFWFNALLQEDFFLEKIYRPWEGDLYIEHRGRTFFFANHQDQLDKMIKRLNEPEPCYGATCPYINNLIQTSQAGVDFFAVDKNSDRKQQWWIVLDFPRLQNHIERSDGSANTLTTAAELAALGLTLTEQGINPVSLWLLGAKEGIFDAEGQHLMPEYKTFLLQGVSMLYGLATRGELVGPSATLSKGKKGRNGLWDILSYQEVTFDDALNDVGGEYPNP